MAGDGLMLPGFSETGIAILGGTRLLLCNTLRRGICEPASHRKAAIR
jgi:hypothetical protein